MIKSTDEDVVEKKNKKKKSVEKISLSNRFQIERRGWFNIFCGFGCCRCRSERLANALCSRRH